VGLDQKPRTGCIKARGRGGKAQEMKKIYLSALVVFAALAFGAIGVTSAFAEDAWLVSGAVPATAQPVLSESMGAFVLEDMGLASVTCPATSPITDEGTVGTETGNVGARFDLTVTVTFPEKGKKCTSSAGEVLEVSAIHLPWLTELVLNGATFLDLILGTGAGAPGYKIVIDILGVSETDECTTETSTTTVTNEETAALVEFLSTATEAESATCTLSKKPTGLVVGKILIFSATAGLAIAVSET
jgi:hypothetical protein